MRIVIILLCASFIVADNIESQYSPFLMGKLVDELSNENSSFKFTASLRRKEKHICTTVLLSNKHALTAAKCLEDFLNEHEIPNFDSYSVVAKRSDVVFSIEAVFTHRVYTFLNPTPKHDIGLIRFRDNMIIESEYVGWAVPPFERAPNCGKVTVTTWKKIDKSIQTEKDNHSVLKKVLFKILDNRKCKFRADAPIVCAQSVDRNHVLTDDDIGAPMSVGQFIVGVLSTLPGNKRPAIFVDVYKSYAEINKLLNDNSPHYRMSLPRKKARYDSKFENKTLDRHLKAKH